LRSGGPARSASNGCEAPFPHGHFCVKMIVLMVARRPKLPLFWQIFLPNAAFLVIAVSVLAFTPAAVNDTPTARQAVGLAVGLLVLVVINVLSIRRRKAGRAPDPGDVGGRSSAARKAPHERWRQLRNGEADWGGIWFGSLKVAPPSVERLTKIVGTEVFGSNGIEEIIHVLCLASYATLGSLTRS
jgi:hypothetical protein